MGLLGGIFGKRRALPLENLAALRAAGAALAGAGYSFAGVAGICLRKSAQSELEIAGMLADAALPARYELTPDEYGCMWIVLRGDLEGVSAAATSAGGRLNEARHGADVLCIAFELEKDGRQAYLMYSRRGLFYPFVPKDGEHDVMLELKLKDAVSGSLAVEGSVSRWHPIWGMPF